MSIQNNKNILDFSLEHDERIALFEEYCKFNKNENTYDNCFELLNRLSGIYQFSGLKIVEQFLIEISKTKNSDISNTIKLEAAKSLLLFDEIDEQYQKNDSEEEKKIKDENNTKILERNLKRKELAYEIINIVCSTFKDSDIPIPCQIESIHLIMKVEKYKKQTNLYFIDIINNQKIDCDYRYKTILSLEKKDILEYKFFIKNACIEFLNNTNNMTMYRILSGQYLLQNCDIYNEKDNIQNILLSFTQDEDLDYNLRADAADTLLTLGDEKMKTIARDTIICLGRIEGNNKTIFDNAQNVHTNHIEKSVLIILDYIMIIPILKINEIPIDISYTEKIILELIKRKNICDKICKNNFSLEENILEKLLLKSKDEHFCSDICKKNSDIQERILLSINRIKLDRTIYRTSTLSDITVKLLSYIQYHKFKDTLENRLLEELDDMSGTCSSGFLSRLMNVISGFDEKFSLSISWEDQIIANFTGRLNFVARKILEKDSPFYKEKLNDIIELFINNNEEVKKHFIKQINKNSSTEIPTMNKIITEFLKTDSETKIQHCVETFSENVLNEMMLDSHKYANRQNFLLFFRTYMSSIREELFEEFKIYISPSEFDLCIRKAISSYEGVNFML
jgi:hypothetical protein